MRAKTILFSFNFTNKRYRNFSMSDDSVTKTNGGHNKMHLWKPADIVHQPYKVNDGHICVVLNRKMSIPEHVATELWQNANIRCCVDGGANRWREFLKLHKHTEHKLKPPDLITGDFDSITDETKHYFCSKNIQYIHMPDQYATDFTKTVKMLKPMLGQNNVQNIVVYHDISGRFDQIMANINTLYKNEEEFFNIYLLSGNSLTWLLKAGEHSITIPSDLVQGQRWCALIPVGQEATNVTTNGLRWNLTNDSLKFGGMVSSSNTYSSCLVEIKTNTALIWSMGLFDFSDE